jgi:hypothetical protein
MFEKLSVRPHRPFDPKTPLDLGSLVEGMLFYQASEVVVNAGGLKQIAEAWSVDGLIALLDSGFVRFRFQENFTGIRTTRTGSARERYEPVVIELAREGAPQLLISRALEEGIGRRGRTRRVTAQVCRTLAIERTDPQITERVKSDLLDVDYVTSSVLRILRILTPEIQFPPSTRFEVQEVDDGLRVLTNIDFIVVNAELRKRLGFEEVVTPALLLTHLVAAREIVEDAARSDADMAVDPVNAAIAELRIASTFTRQSLNEAQILEFQEFLFDEGRAIREAVNSGEVSYKDVLRLLENSEKFKSWLRDQPADTRLLKEYFRSASSSTWVDKLPSKTLRWIMFSGAGATVDSLGAGGLGSAIGMTLGAVDSLVLDRLLKGWKPNQFVENSVQPFLRRSSRGVAKHKPAR